MTNVITVGHVHTFTLKYFILLMLLFSERERLFAMELNILSLCLVTVIYSCSIVFAQSDLRNILQTSWTIGDAKGHSGAGKQSNIDSINTDLHIQRLNEESNQLNEIQREYIKEQLNGDKISNVLEPEINNMLEKDITHAQGFKKPSSPQGQLTLHNPSPITDAFRINTALPNPTSFSSLPNQHNRLIRSIFSEPIPSSSGGNHYQPKQLQDQAFSYPMHMIPTTHNKFIPEQTQSRNFKHQRALDILNNNHHSNIHSANDFANRRDHHHQPDNTHFTSGERPLDLSGNLNYEQIKNAAGSVISDHFNQHHDNDEEDNVSIDFHSIKPII